MILARKTRVTLGAIRQPNRSAVSFRNAAQVWIGFGAASAKRKQQHRRIHQQFHNGPLHLRILQRCKIATQRLNRCRTGFLIGRKFVYSEQATGAMRKNRAVADRVTDTARFTATGTADDSSQVSEQSRGL
jgi:hypothetical protein